jgi:DNA-binding response OmpR family regulator
LVISNKKILVFEKDKKCRHIIDILCRKLGHDQIVDVETQETFDEAIDSMVDKTAGLGGLLGKSARPKLNVDLFIIDCESPNGRLPTLVKAIKSKYAGNLRFLIVGGAGTASELADAIRAGATDTIVKPFTREEFTTKMDNVLSENPITVTTFSVGGGFEEKPFAAPAPKAEPPKPAAKVEAPAAVASAPLRANERNFGGVAASAPPPEPADPDATGKGGKGHSFYRHTGKKRTAESGDPTASLVNGKIDGHYHEKVEIVGGGENCYWAREIPGEKVRLEYITPKGAASGVEAKVISREEFMHNYFLCEEYGCHILKRLGKWPPKTA